MESDSHLTTFFKKLEGLIDPESGGVELGKGTIALDLKNQAWTLGELAY
jgi:hypothetical protein